jgi:hypothetical protein
MKTSITRTLLAAAAVALLSVPALAQPSDTNKSKKNEPLVPPTPPPNKSDIPWTPYIVAVVLAGLVVGVNFIPSKRGHQD